MELNPNRESPLVPIGKPLHINPMINQHSRVVESGENFEVKLVRGEKWGKSPQVTNLIKIVAFFLKFETKA